ncbi:hypothetical protein Asal01_02729 [Fodinibius salicampi]
MQRKSESQNIDVWLKIAVPVVGTSYNQQILQTNFYKTALS